MTLVYRGTGPWGAGKGSRLTIAEGDGNIYDLSQRIVALETNPPEAISITGVTQPSPTTLMFTLSDLSTIGPVTIPASSWHYLDTGWQAFTVFHINDLFTYNGVIYLVQIDHTSGGSFNPAITNGSGTLYYKAVLALPGDMLPTGGDIGTVLTKTGINDFQCSWGFAHYLVAGGTTGQFLSKVSNTDYDVDWTDAVNTLVGLSDVDLTITTPTVGQALTFQTTIGGNKWINTDVAPKYPPVQAQAGLTWGPSLDDEGTYNRFTNSGGCVITVPTNSGVAFDIGTEIHLRQANTGTVSINPAGGVTINTPSDTIAVLLEEGATATLKKVDTNEWDLFGLLSPA